MKTKMFISHASADEGVVSLFVDHILVAGSGVKLEDIVYTTRDDTGVLNGDDIPTTIKNNIRESRMFFMMVSENYRKSEVCLNEMGAAWMADDIERIIILLPGVGFDRLGWLMIHNKASLITNPQALDMIHDRVTAAMCTSSQTLTWNRNKELFISRLAQLSGTLEEVAVPEMTEEMDILDLREQFDNHSRAYSEILTKFTSAIYEYSGSLKSMNQKMQQLRSNPKSLTPAQVRSVMLAVSHDTDMLSEVFESDMADLQCHFDKSISYAILLQKYDNRPESRKRNRQEMQKLIDNMIYLKDNMSSFMATMDGIVDLDKNFKKARVRLVAAVDKFLNVVSFCITRANDYKMS